MTGQAEQSIPAITAVTSESIAIMHPKRNPNSQTKVLPHSGLQVGTEWGQTSTVKWLQTRQVLVSVFQRMELPLPLAHLFMMQAELLILVGYAYLRGMGRIGDSAVEISTV